MSKDYKQELKDMERLMMYGLSESKTQAPDCGVLEYSQMGADGRTYGILREGTKYFVKVAPKKDTKVLAEDFDYIGGFMEKKPYDSYTKASKALNLHLINLNEEVEGSEPVKSQFSLNESAEWQTPTTKETRKELNRFYELVSKVDTILNENVHYISEDKNSPFTEKPSKKDGGGHKGNIGTQQPLGITEKGFTDNDEKDAEKKQKDYENAKVNSFKTPEMGDHNVDEDGGNAYQEKPAKVNEGKKRSVRLTEEQFKQVLAWRNDRAFVHKDVDTDRSHGTEIGDSDPYTDKVNESFETDEWGSEGVPSSPGTGDAKKYPDPFGNKNGVRQPVTENFEECGGVCEDDEFYGNYDDDEKLQSARDILAKGLTDDERDERIYNHLDTFGDDDASLGFDGGGFGGEDGLEYDELGGSYSLNEDVDNILGDAMNSLNSIDGGGDVMDEIPETDGDMPGGEDEGGEYIFEVTLNDFGKHPAYRKKPMTLPANADGSEWGEDWNDESAKNELPFGRKIGKGDPFNKKVDEIANSVVEALSKKKSY